MDSYRGSGVHSTGENRGPDDYSNVRISSNSSGRSRKRIGLIKEKQEDQRALSQIRQRGRHDRVGSHLLSDFFD